MRVEIGLSDLDRMTQERIARRFVNLAACYPHFVLINIQNAGDRDLRKTPNCLLVSFSVKNELL